MLKFYLGTHLTEWLTMPSAPAPLFISAIRLRSRPVKHSVVSWALDSGGFSEIAAHGRWLTSPEDYVDDVRRWRDELDGMQWAAIQDWMCEPQMIAKTGLTIREHQRRTVDSYHRLTALAPELPWVPVLQGWERDDYLDCWRLYEDDGISLAERFLVGLGSVCRRQGTDDAEAIVADLARHGLRLHLFGFKTRGLKACAHLAESADSMAWSYRARQAWKRDQQRLCGTEHKGGCAHCLPWAKRWRSTRIGPLVATSERCPLFGV